MQFGFDYFVLILCGGTAGESQLQILKVLRPSGRHARLPPKPLTVQIIKDYKVSAARITLAGDISSVIPTAVNEQKCQRGGWGQSTGCGTHLRASSLLAGCSRLPSLCLFKFDQITNPSHPVCPRAGLEPVRTADLRAKKKKEGGKREKKEGETINLLDFNPGEAGVGQLSHEHSSPRVLPLTRARHLRARFKIGLSWRARRTAKTTAHALLHKLAINNGKIRSLFSPLIIKREPGCFLI